MWDGSAGVNSTIPQARDLVKAISRALEVSSNMRHNRLGLPVDRRFQHHFVVRIGQLRPPNEANLHRINTERQFRKKTIHIRRAAHVPPA